MSVPIILFYHCVFSIDGKHLPSSRPIVHEQMQALKSSGLEDAASEIYVGINGDESSKPHAAGLLPEKAKVRYHGTQCRNELRTLLMVEDWCRTHEGEAYMLLLHSKGASHPPGSDYAKNMSTPWRQRMLRHCVYDWRTCVKDLRKGADAVGAHWITGQGWDKSQHYFAGTCYWVKASFFRTIPSVTTRQRIKDSGIDALESRFEAEVHLGNGPRLPKVKSYYDGNIGT
jgi:hypothetical protein